MMRKAIFLTLITFFLFVSCSAAEKNIVPPFLKEGKNYVMIIGTMVDLDVKVLKIDHASGWVQIKPTIKNSSEEWVNLRKVTAILIPEKVKED